MKPSDLIRSVFTRKLELGAFGAIFAFVLWANLITPLWADDYCRSIPFDIRNTFHIVYGNYFYWTGRYFTTLITFFFMEMKDYHSIFLFDILNSIIFCCLVFNCCKISENLIPRGVKHDEDRVSAINILFIFLALWWIPRDIAEVALWKTGSIGYLWPVTGELWILRQVLAKRTHYGLAACCFVFFISTFLEPLSLLMSIVLVCYGIGSYRRRAAVPWGFIAAHMLGTAFLWLAPGNYVRARVMEHDTVLHRLDGLFGNFGSLFDLYWLPFIAILLICYVSSRKAGHVGRRSPELSGKVGFFIGLALIYMAGLLLFPRSSLAARVSFPASVYIVCVLGMLFVNRPDMTMARVMAVRVGIFGMVIWHMWICVPDLVYLARISRTWVDLTTPHSKNYDDVTLPRVTMGSRHKLLYVHKDIIFVGISPDPHSMMNVCFARALGVKSVHSEAE
ncbi:DUF6056 family protein [Novacetimonas cocois]|uniref:DUF6056 family protein n=1 Tax=Novacetimonas cocois TaxID=1747507 RepID=UPI001057C808|nr:DUF6056 family protein [Novacetimonas cocois]